MPQGQAQGLLRRLDLERVLVGVHPLGEQDPIAVDPLSQQFFRESLRGLLAGLVRDVRAERWGRDRMVCFSGLNLARRPDGTIGILAGDPVSGGGKRVWCVSRRCPGRGRLAAVTVGVAGHGALDAVPGGTRCRLGVFPGQARVALGAFPVVLQLAFGLVEALALVLAAAGVAELVGRLVIVVAVFLLAVRLVLVGRAPMRVFGRRIDRFARRLAQRCTCLVAPS